MTQYTSVFKPAEHRRSAVHLDNLSNPDKQWYLEEGLFSNGEHESFNGFSGAPEFSPFPLRQLFLKKYNTFPSEWDTGYFKQKDMEKIVLENEKNVVSTHYDKKKNLSKCLISLGGPDKIYLLIYNRDRHEVNSNLYAICLLFLKRTARVEKLMRKFEKLAIPEENQTFGFINILVKDVNGYRLETKKITPPVIDFNLNYNAGLSLINKLIIDKLSIPDSKGLVLLHGLPGTGKTTYIRHLISTLKKRVIYIPPAMTSSISDPELIKFFITNSNSILVIEDAENVLMKRAEHSTQAIANILNLTDGLLSDCANIQIVATFNTDIINIDDALLRKGRLIAKYEFTELEESRAIKLSKKLGLKSDGKHTLAEIYNANEMAFTKKKNKIGF